MAYQANVDDREKSKCRTVTFVRLIYVRDNDNRMLYTPALKGESDLQLVNTWVIFLRKYITNLEDQIRQYELSIPDVKRRNAAKYQETRQMIDDCSAIHEYLTQHNLEIQTAFDFIQFRHGYGNYKLNSRLKLAVVPVYIDPATI
jgi:hypothetical protein